MLTYAELERIRDLEETISKLTSAILSQDSCVLDVMSTQYKVIIRETVYSSCGGIKSESKDLDLGIEVPLDVFQMYLIDKRRELEESLKEYITDYPERKDG